MNRSRRRLSDADLAFYEDNVARQLRIIERVRVITLDLDADSLAHVHRFLTDIIEAAGGTKKDLIAAMTEAKDSTIEE